MNYIRNHRVVGIKFLYHGVQRSSVAELKLLLFKFSNSTEGGHHVFSH